MTNSHTHNGNRIWFICSWENGPICYGMALDLIGGISLIAFSVLLVGVIFFGWFGIFPKVIRRKLHD
ncbi:uncharacterized protein CELE_F25H8.7 [Caenorhabditis elegans]|uniref:Spermiogenesis protein SPE-29 n=1 Tax=Caenorhabditis elegans TaxID=6239 RepID=G5ED71_CAEEL|nr:Uncharacterized protein CELE_F25H8.7 [Caenorhabditis elegans]AAC15230.1 spermiogenesis protein SPE-29 [Caenorhabditis elegans]CAC35823.1 Uncharacterized protein CELE_F25H8.7 [Caenorhabditis elegans]|eukprot:NP_501791.1 Uncharacterized protein CELE_F25H8.7 [Caenorhabditis elegans]